MNQLRCLTLGLCVLLCHNAYSASDEMDKELASLAAKLANQIKENGKKKVTVLDFTDLQGNSSELGRYIAEQLTVELVMAKRDFSVLDRANLKRILAEHKLTASGLVDPENAKKLGLFAGVDTIVLGSIVPKAKNISLTAKLITTDTAEIVGASKAEFASDEIVQQLLSQATKAEEATDSNRQGSASSTKPSKPFGDLQAKVESITLQNDNNIYSFVRTALIISNTSSTKIYGVALDPDFYHKFNVTNSRGEDFQAFEVTGVGTAFERDGGFNGSLTDISPNTSITITAKSQVRWNGKPGDYRPYRLQTVVIFGEENNGRYPNIRKHNLIIDVK